MSGRDEPPADAPAPVDVAALYRDDRSRLVRIATAITLDRAVAEEVVQEAFAQLQRRREQVDKPAAYVQRSVVNLSLKHRRRWAVSRAYVPPPHQLTGVPELDETWAVVTRLPARQRAVVVLRFWSDLTEPDIAEALGWPLGTVKSTLHRALATLRKELTP